MENKMKQDVKMSLPLVLKNRSPRRTASHAYGDGWSCILSKVSSGFSR